MHRPLIELPRTGFGQPVKSTNARRYLNSLPVKKKGQYSKARDTLYSVSRALPSRQRR
jgi:hypothetical protein